MNKVSDAQECANKLIEQANSFGGQDNITVIVVDINSAVPKKHQKKSKRTAFFIILAFILIVVAAIAGVYVLVDNSAYLCEEEGYISIYKGVPGNFLGIELSHKEYGSDVWVKDLRESTQEHFKDGVVKVDNLSSA